FTDLCRGPHLQDSRPIKAVKLTGLAGAYWRGDEKNTQLTRIYGTAFYSQADLDAYLQRLEDARRRDHRKLGPQLDLFHFSEHSQHVRSKLRRYRERPVQYAEPTPLHCNEFTATLHGLLRIRMITQADAHISCSEDQIHDEIAGVVAYARYLYELFRMSTIA